MNNDTDLDAEIIHAVTIINDVVFDLRHHDGHAIAIAHTTLARRSDSLQSPLREAVDHYLADETWHRGPHLLRHAVEEIARHAGIPDHTTAQVFEQPTLF